MFECTVSLSNGVFNSNFRTVNFQIYYKISIRWDKQLAYCRCVYIFYGLVSEPGHINRTIAEM